MAMIKCNECGKEMSDQANTCPSCGCPNRPRKVCPECGESMDINQTVCQRCGYVFKTTKNGMGVGGKSKLAAALLGFFLGSLGIHNFYLGYTGKAVGQLLLTVLSCFTLSWITWIWAIVESVMILTGSINTDADGEPLVD